MATETPTTPDAPRGESGSSGAGGHKGTVAPTTPDAPPRQRRPGEAPFVGPSPFKEEDRDIFFGRVRETNDLASLVLAHSEVLLYAQSGAGKTSLIHAGLVPLLKGAERCEILRARVQGQLQDIDQG